MSNLTVNEISYSFGFLIGRDNLPTANNSFSSLYNPILVIYGLNSECVIKFEYSPDGLYEEPESYSSCLPTSL